MVRRETSYPGVTLRAARCEGPDNDLAFLRAVYAAARAEEMAQLRWSAQQKAAFLAHQFEAQHSHYHTHFPTARYDVICLGDKAVGRYYVAALEGELRVMDITLLPEERGHGIGERLIRDVLDEASRSRCAVSLHVEENNRAKRLYERLGFVEVEDTGVYKLMRWVPTQANTAS